MDGSIEEMDRRKETSDPVTGATSTVTIARIAVEPLRRR